jgi:hypothetical protein
MEVTLHEHETQRLAFLGSYHVMASAAPIVVGEDHPRYVALNSEGPVPPQTARNQNCYEGVPT